MNFDVLVVGGSAGGTAAAMAAAEAGVSVCLIEETDWLGGQLTTQGVCTPDEQQHIETFGGTRRYTEFRDSVRQYYREHYRLSTVAQESTALNPGACWVSRLSYEPKVGAEILRERLRPLVEYDKLTILYRTRVVACLMDAATGTRIESVVVRDEDGTEQHLTARYVLDATDLGDLLPLCGVEGTDWVVGAESRAETGEPDAPDTARPDWVQPFTFPFALEWSPETEADNVISPPDDYAELKALQKYHIKHGAITGLFFGHAPWWTYRRVLAKQNFDDPRVPNDLAMINTAGNDYYGDNIIGYAPGSPAAGHPQRNEETATATMARARRASLGYVYWLQTECPREDPETGAIVAGRTGYPEFRLRRDLFDTPDGCAIRPYIREARRIRSLRPILEQEIVVKDFQGGIHRGDNARAAFMPDSIGIGHYALDIHPNGHGEPNAYVATRPFQIPLGALIPARLDNLLPACKNLGVTHLTNGAYRLHPIEWNIGESAGLLAAFCLQNSLTPRAVYADPSQLHAFQQRLLQDGIALHWFIDVPLLHPAFVAVQTLATLGLPLANPTDLLFRPNDPITADEWRTWRKNVHTVVLETFTGTRTEAATALLSARHMPKV
jgi:hypothetical protein